MCSLGLLFVARSIPMIRSTGRQLHKLPLLWRCIPVRRSMEPPVIESHIRERIRRFDLIRIVVPSKHCFVPECDVCPRHEGQRKNEQSREGGFGYHGVRYDGRERSIRREFGGLDQQEFTGQRVVAMSFEATVYRRSTSTLRLRCVQEAEVTRLAAKPVCGSSESSVKILRLEVSQRGGQQMKTFGK